MRQVTLAASPLTSHTERQMNTSPMLHWSKVVVYLYTTPTMQHSTMWTMHGRTSASTNRSLHAPFHSFSPHGFRSLISWQRLSRTDTCIAQQTHVTVHHNCDSFMQLYCCCCNYSVFLLFFTPRRHDVAILLLHATSVRHVVVLCV